MERLTNPSQPKIGDAYGRPLFRVRGSPTDRRRRPTREIDAVGKLTLASFLATRHNGEVGSDPTETGETMAAEYKLTEVPFEEVLRMIRECPHTVSTLVCDLGRISIYACDACGFESTGPGIGFDHD